MHILSLIQRVVLKDLVQIKFETIKTDRKLNFKPSFVPKIIRPELKYGIWRQSYKQNFILKILHFISPLDLNLDHTKQWFSLI